MHTFRTAAQHCGVARLDTERGSVSSNIGTALINNANHAQRHGHPLDQQPIGSFPLSENPAQRIGHRDDRFDTSRNRLDTAGVKPQPVQHGRGQVALRSGVEVTLIGCQYFVLP